MDVFLTKPPSRTNLQLLTHCPLASSDQLSILTFARFAKLVRKTPEHATAWEELWKLTMFEKNLQWVWLGMCCFSFSVLFHILLCNSLQIILSCN